MPKSEAVAHKFGSSVRTLVVNGRTSSLLRWRPINELAAAHCPAAIRKFPKNNPTPRFWLPQRDLTFVDVRLYGKKVLTIAHHDYSVNLSVAVDASIERTESF
ncbi:MAG: hypothetical protein WA372_10615 [Candidatus Sulfotelmatobacter sp.]